MKIVLGITGASGAIYAKRLLDILSATTHTVEIVVSKNGHEIFSQETQTNLEKYSYKIFPPSDFRAPFASGSAQYDQLVIVPCSMGSLGRIAHGASDDLLTRTADVFLKERRKLILVPRETPFSTLHLENLLKLSQLGALILPACPSFYSQASDINTLVDTVTARILDHMGIPHSLKVRYGEHC